MLMFCGWGEYLASNALLTLAEFSMVMKLCLADWMALSLEENRELFDVACWAGCKLSRTFGNLGVVDIVKIFLHAKKSCKDFSTQSKKL